MSNLDGYWRKGWDPKFRGNTFMGGKTKSVGLFESCSERAIGKRILILLCTGAVKDREGKGIADLTESVMQPVGNFAQPALD
ncbi:MAG: hypothetical protein IPO07_23130 [Haliscomenobacter sp.]|nr:hypothetical protein [Haliscomenobacter sp.]MBK9491362.1 hypothetical protein [Haliscomenobacter sp.]